MLTLPHRAALSYAALDLPACPIIGKAPCHAGGHGWSDATADLAALDALFTSREHSGCGIATGQRANAWVLDVDGPGGLQSIRSLIDQHGELPRGPICRTGGGGWHVWFRWDDRCAALRNRVGFAPGLDIRTGGGGVVVPPSVHESGRRYEWRVGRSVYDLEMPAAPDWLLSAIVGSYKTTAPIPQRDAVTVTDRYAEGALVSAVQRIVTAGNGQQRRTLYTEALSIGARVVGPGLCPASVALDRLTAAGMRMVNHKQHQKWTVQAVQRIVDDGLSAGVGRVGHAA
jgi:hypothetical protein